jgi:restriction system protein
MARGFFAELQRQNKAAAREQDRLNREAVRLHNAAVREAERAQKAEARAIAQWERANEAERKRLEKEAKLAHVARMESEAEERNLALAEVADDLASLLGATLEVDDFVDLDAMRIRVDHPPFARNDLEVPTPPPAPIPDIPNPVLASPPPPKGVAALLGKRRHRKAVTRAKEVYDQAQKDRPAKQLQVQKAREVADIRHQKRESKRLAALKIARSNYEQECLAREAKVRERNDKIDAFIANLGYGDVEAIQEYVSIVLASSVYPAHFPVEHEFEFHASSAELRLKVLVPSPDCLPTIKAYKYNKAKDAITTTNLSQKACKDQYASAVHQVTLRSLHEVFEADRRGLIQTISLEVGTKTNDPATGLTSFIVFVATAAERDAFMALDLSNVVPAATLDHLGASMSKNPFGLLPAKTSGVRRS